MRFARHRCEHVKMFAVAAPGQSAELEIRATAEPSALMRAPDVLRDVLSSWTRLAFDVEEPDTRSIRFCCGDGHGISPLLEERDAALRCLVSCHGSGERTALAVIDVDSFANLGKVERILKREQREIVLLGCLW
jgi:hypothetical protein